MSNASGGTLLGPVMLDIAGQDLSPEDRELIEHPLVGGVLLFTRNYRDPEQLKRLCDDILAVKKTRPLLAVDHEGGRVQRFRVGFSRIPAMRTLGKLHEESPSKALEEARRYGELIGQELGGFGFDLPFAPVLDRDCEISQIIGDRAFAGECGTLVELARAFWQGLNAAGLSATGKHFPGHGAVVADSHVELPVDRRQRPVLDADMQPFKALMDEGLESIMMAHVRYTSVDPLPASLSERWIRGVIRREWKYNGAIFCDDLSMGGAAVVGTLEERAMMALEAGCDMIPVCNDRHGAMRVLESLRGFKINRLSSARLKRLYRRPAPVAATA
ncbi:MAG: beta-N-acetylhexosaminidase [Stagnimonas sp.]|nr:beta-N-acetylhexosaminidase [Stagnimonas sp.]